MGVEDRAARWNDGRRGSCCPVSSLAHLIGRQVHGDAPVLVAGDFNDWGLRITHMMAQAGLHEWAGTPVMTFPSRLPLAALDHVYARGLTAQGCMAPRGRIWRRMSDHLPLMVDFSLE